jgi:hypothetical protein
MGVSVRGIGAAVTDWVVLNSHLNSKALVPTVFQVSKGSTNVNALMSCGPFNDCMLAPEEPSKETMGKYTRSLVNGRDFWHVEIFMTISAWVLQMMPFGSSAGSRAPLLPCCE